MSSDETTEQTREILRRIDAILATTPTNLHAGVLATLEVLTAPGSDLVTFMASVERQERIQRTLQLGARLPGAVRAA